jgi:tape measure domain-containing protein
MAQGILSIKIRADASPLERALKVVGRDMAAFSQKALAIGRGVTLGFTGPIIAMGSSFVNAAASMDQLERGMAAIMGSTSEAGKELSKLKESAKLPGLGFEEAVRGSIRLQAVGLQAEQARKILETFGKAIATTGGGAVELEAVQYQLTQMISKNRILAEDFKPIQSAVPLIGKALQAAFNTDNIEAVRATGVGAKEFAMRLTESLAVLPEVLNSTGGIRNQFDNLRDALKFASAEMGKAILKNIDLEAVIDSVTQRINMLSDWFGSLSDGMQKFILSATKNIAIFGGLAWIIGQVGSALGTFIYVMGQAVKVLYTYDKVTKTVALTTGGWITIIAAAAIAVGLLVNNYNNASKPMDTFNDHLSVGAKNARKETVEFNSLMGVLQDANTSLSTRSTALETINTKYKDYLPNLIEEATSIDAIRIAQEKGNIALQNKFKVLAAQGVLEKQSKKLLDLREELFILEQERTKFEKTPQGPTTGFGSNVSTQYDVQGSNIEKLKSKIETLQNAYNKTATSVTNLTKEQSAYNDQLKADKVEYLSNKVKDLNVFLEEGTKKYGKNSDTVKKLQVEITKYRSELNTLLNFEQEKVKTNDDLNNSTDKVKTKYELLNEELKTTEDKYKSVVLTQGALSADALALADKYRQVKDSLTKVNEQFDKIESRKLIVTPLAQFQAPKDVEFKEIFTDDIGARIQKITGFIGGVSQSMRDLGNTSEEVGTIVKGAITEGIVQPMTDAQYQIEKTMVDIEKLNDQLTDLVENTLTEVAFALGEQLGNALAGAGFSINMILMPIADALVQFGKMAIAAGVAALNIKIALETLGGVGAIAAGIALVALGTFVKSQLKAPALAEGGLAFGPTMAMVGDNRNAGIDPEVIAPLSKLKAMLGDTGGGTPYILKTSISGTDLQLILERTDSKNLRIR